MQHLKAGLSRSLCDLICQTHQPESQRGAVQHKSVPIFGNWDAAGLPHLLKINEGIRDGGQQECRQPTSHRKSRTLIKWWVSIFRQCLPEDVKIENNRSTAVFSDILCCSYCRWFNWKGRWVTTKLKVNLKQTFDNWMSENANQVCFS